LSEWEVVRKVEEVVVQWNKKLEVVLEEVVVEVVEEVVEYSKWWWMWGEESGWVQDSGSCIRVVVLTVFVCVG